MKLWCHELFDETRKEKQNRLLVLEEKKKSWDNLLTKLLEPSPKDRSREKKNISDENALTQSN